MYICKFCNKDCHNNGGLRAHEPYCKQNPNRINRSVSLLAGRKPGIPAWNKGLTAETSEKVKQCKETYRKHFNEGKFVGSQTGKKHTQEYKNKMSIITKKRHENGWDNKCGRALKYKYYSKIAGDITVDGSWELAVAKYLDDKHYNWKRNKKRFKYINLVGNEAFYTPDFYLTDENIYIEVKGYETELDRCKWKQFPEILLVWKKQDLINLGIL